MDDHGRWDAVKSPFDLIPQQPPPFWPKLTGRLHTEAIIARVGSLLGVCFTLCFVTGLLSHYQYHPWTWLPIPGAPTWGYRLSQGLHVITGMTLIPMLLIKLWAVYPRLFAWPPFKNSLQALERLSILLLVSSAMVEVIIGFLNILQWYAWPWDFVYVHYSLAFVAFGSVVLHVAIKLEPIRRGWATPVDAAPDPDRDGAVAAAPPARPSRLRLPTLPALPAFLTRSRPGGISRRGVLIASGAGVGVVALTTAGQVSPAFRKIALLAPRRTETGPQGVPVNMTAAGAGVEKKAMDTGWTLIVDGPRPFQLDLPAVEALEAHERKLPIACVEGWSVSATWRGPRLIDLVRRAGGDEHSIVVVHSLQEGGYDKSTIQGSQLTGALLATHLNDKRLNLDHGYPLRLIAPNRAGVLNTKWLTRVEIS